MDPTQPRGTIKPQILNSLPIGVETTLVNDSVALVDDPTALVGSQTTQIPDLRIQASTNAPKGYIDYRQ